MKTKLSQIFLLLSMVYVTISCEFEPYEVGTLEDLIQKESSLYGYLQTVSQTPEAPLLKIGCVEFIYPFLLFTYDTEESFVTQTSILDTTDFITFLNNLNDGYSISLSYPISGVLPDGTILEVTSNEELEASLETCISENLEIILGECNAIATEMDCIWRIEESSVPEDPYILSNFDIQEDGSVRLSVDESEYKGTWIFYFIGDILHLNMAFGPEEENQNDPSQSSIQEDWNYDWEITYIDEEKIILKNNEEQQYTLIRDCEKEEEPVARKN